MAVGDPVEYFFYYCLDFLFVDLVIFAHHVLFEVEIVIVEDYFQNLLIGFVANLEKRNNIGMAFQRFQKRYFSERSRGDSLLFVFELDVLNRDKVVVFVDGFENSSESSLPDLANFFIIIDFFHLNNYIAEIGFGYY